MSGEEQNENNKYVNYAHITKINHRVATSVVDFRTISPKHIVFSESTVWHNGMSHCKPVIHAWSYWSNDSALPYSAWMFIEMTQNYIKSEHLWNWSLIYCCHKTTAQECLLRYCVERKKSLFNLQFTLAGVNTVCVWARIMEMLYSTSSFVQLCVSRCIATSEHWGAGEGIMREWCDQSFITFFCGRRRRERKKYYNHTK